MAAIDLAVKHGPPAATDLDGFVGKQGRAATTLGPLGSVEIDGHELGAMTVGESIEPGTVVKVIRIQPAQLVVAVVEDAGSH